MIITICLVIFGIIGTTMMTIFSFIYSYITNYSFNEPNLLNYVLVTSEFLFLRRLGEQQIIGWIFHYLIGIAFAYLYYKGIDIYDFDSTLPNGVLYGIILSVLGISGWACLLFKNFPNFCNNAGSDFLPTRRCQLFQKPGSSNMVRTWGPTLPRLRRSPGPGT